MLVNRVTRTIHESPPNGRDQLDPGHPHLRKMDPRDLDALLADGYTMCGNCFPGSSGSSSSQSRPAATTTRRPQSAPEKVDERVSATSESDGDGDGEDD